MTMVEFPDMKRAKRWYFSPEYEKTKRAREGAIDMRLLFIEGVATLVLRRQPMAPGASLWIRPSPVGGRAGVGVLGGDDGW